MNDLIFLSFHVKLVTRIYLYERLMIHLLWIVLLPLQTYFFCPRIFSVQAEKRNSDWMTSSARKKKTRTLRERKWCVDLSFSLVSVSDIWKQSFCTITTCPAQEFLNEIQTSHWRFVKNLYMNMATYSSTNAVSGFSTTSSDFGCMQQYYATSGKREECTLDWSPVCHLYGRPTPWPINASLFLSSYGSFTNH